MRRKDLVVRGDLEPYEAQRSAAGLGNLWQESCENLAHGHCRAGMWTNERSVPIAEVVRGS